MRFRVVASFCLTLLLAACSSTPHSGAAAEADAAATPGTDAAACAAQGGELRPLGRLQRVQCVVPYADAGKTCSAKADCSGQCLGSTELVAGAAASGTCQRDISQNFGCHQRIDNGVAQGTLCVD